MALSDLTQDELKAQAMRTAGGGPQGNVSPNLAQQVMQTDNPNQGSKEQTPYYQQTKWDPVNDAKDRASIPAMTNAANMLYQLPEEQRSQVWPQVAQALVQDNPKLTSIINPQVVPTNEMLSMAGGFTQGKGMADLFNQLSGAGNARADSMMQRNQDLNENLIGRLGKEGEKGLKMAEEGFQKRFQAKMIEIDQQGKNSLATQQLANQGSMDVEKYRSGNQLETERMRQQGQIGTVLAARNPAMAQQLYNNASTGAFGQQQLQQPEGSTPPSSPGGTPNINISPGAPSGQQVQIQMPMGNGSQAGQSMGYPLEKGAQEEVQKNVVDSSKYRNTLQELYQNFDPAEFTAQRQVSDTMLDKGEKYGAINLSDEQKQQVSNAAQNTQRVNEILATIKKPLLGTRWNEQMEEMAKSIAIDMNSGPTKAKAAMDRLAVQATQTDEIQKQLMTRGIQADPTIVANGGIDSAYDSAWADTRRTVLATDRNYIQAFKDANKDNNGFIVRDSGDKIPLNKASDADILMYREHSKQQRVGNNLQQQTQAAPQPQVSFPTSSPTQQQNVPGQSPGASPVYR